LAILIFVLTTNLQEVIFIRTRRFVLYYGSLGDSEQIMANQKIFGLAVTAQKVPMVEKPEEHDQCYLCGFTFSEEDCMIIYSDEKLEDKRKAHSKCIHNHLKLLPKDAKVAIVSIETNEVLSYTTVSGNA